MALGDCLCAVWPVARFDSPRDSLVGLRDACREFCLLLYEKNYQKGQNCTTL